MPSAQASARWRDEDDLWLDHVTLRDADLAWLQPVARLTMWAVTVPVGLLAALPHLRCLDLRGGSASDLSVVQGCVGLRYLKVNQVRGLTDLSVLPTLTDLRLLSLYGLPRVRALPPLGALHRLQRLELGSMKGLHGLTGAHDAPALRELLLLRAVGLARDDADRLAANEGLEQFDWIADDVPVRTWSPFVEAVGKARARGVPADQWLRQHHHL